MKLRANADAEKVLEYFYISSPEDINLELICAGLNAFVEEKEIDGSEGRITHNGKNAIISVSSNINNIQKKRFVIAHELGHFRLHNDSKLFLCNKNDFFSWQKENDPEVEANHFAASLLMPTNLFLDASKGKIISVELISSLANLFNTSFTATAFRYVNIGQHPSAMIFCTNGIIKWSVVNKDFPFKFIKLNEKVSNNSYVSDFFKGIPLPSSDEKIPLDAWFEHDFNYKNDVFIYEQCFPLEKYNSVISLVWMD